MELKKPEKQYHANHGLVYSCQYHVIFCPKYRRKILVDDVAVRVEEMILEKQEAYQYIVLDMEVMPDHVHLLLDVNPKVGINKVVGQIKGYTAHTLKQEFPSLKTRLPNIWTRSKFISTVGAVTLSVVQQYIENQKGK